MRRDGTAGSTGYTIIYSKDKDFKRGVYTYRTSNPSRISAELKTTFRAGETWYFKIRTNYTSGGKTYGTYSPVKSIRIK